MCTVTKCGCSSDGSGFWSAIGALIVGFALGLWFLIRRVIVPLVRHVIAPATVIAAVLAWRWFSGAALNGHARPATFRRGSIPPALPRRRFLPRLHWAHWPGYQRALVRWVATALVVAGLFYPVATTAALATAIAATVAARFTIRRAQRRRPAVIRVTAAVVDRPAPALTAGSDAPMWSAASAEAATR